jgi:hypothetical protein
MKKLLMTTAILTTMAGGVTAQQILVPEGFSAYEDVGRLTFEDLNGQTVYDSNGEAIGEIADIVFAAGAVMTPEGTDVDDAMATDPATDMTDTDMTDTMDTDVGAETEADAMASDGAATEGVAETDAMQDGVDTTADPATTDPATAADDSMAQDTADAVENAADATADAVGDAADATADAADDATTEDMATGDDMAADAGDDMAADTAAMDAGQDMAATEGQVSHVIVDIGGFLGLGVHTVAVPIEALEVYADAGDMLQLYLPWTEEQLRDLPEYDEADPATLGRTTDLGE